MIDLLSAPSHKGIETAIKGTAQEARAGADPDTLAHCAFAVSCETAEGREMPRSIATYSKKAHQSVRFVTEDPKCTHLAPEIECAISGFVLSRTSASDVAHRFGHIQAVVNNIKMIGDKVRCNSRIAICSGYFHDVVPRAEGAPYCSAVEKSAELALQQLPRFGLTAHEASRVADAIVSGSWEHAKTGGHPISIEASVLRDADLLEAAGAHGVARVFAFSGSQDISIDWFDFDPDHPPRLVSKSEGPDPSAFHHFCTKLLWLEEFIATDVARDEMRKRRRYMIEFLKAYRRENNWAS